jgi:hypothetical protein
MSEDADTGLARVHAHIEFFELAGKARFMTDVGA